MPETTDRSATGGSPEQTHGGDDIAPTVARSHGDADSRPAQRKSPAATPAGGLARLQLSRFSGVFVFAALFILFSLWIPELFLTGATWKTIAQTNAVTAIVALGLLAPLAAGAYDLSIGQTAGFSSIVCGILMVDGRLGIFPAILVTLLVGAMIGIFNGFLVGILRVDSFIATLGTLALLQAGSTLLSNGQYVGPFPDSFTAITNQSVFGVPILAVYMIIAAVIGWYVLEHTPLGRRVYATGANSEAARLAGVPTRRVVFFSMVTGSTVASLAGVLLASSLNTVNENIGPQYLLPAFAAAFLGTTQIKMGRFNVWGTILALFLLGTGVQGLLLVGADVWVTNAFNGAALILAVVFVSVLSRRRKRREVEAAAS